MKNSQLTTNALKLAEDSVIQLLKQIDNLLTALQKHTNTHTIKNVTDQIVMDNIKTSLVSLRSHPYMLSDMVSRWKSGSPQILSKMGMELEVLNETMATLSATFCFLLSRKIAIGDFVFGEVNDSYINLVFCNRILTEE